MTGEGASSGYLASRFATEAGDGSRTNVVRTPGLALQPGDRLDVIRRATGRWNQSLVWQGDNLLLFSTSLPGGSPFGRVERIDPVTLETIIASPNLETGGHIWEGGCLAHRNGDIYAVTGCFLYRLNTDLEVVGQMEMPTPRPYDSLFAMNDGRLLMKDFPSSGTTSRFTVVDADDLSTVMELPIPEATIGKCCVSGDDIYVPGEYSIFRFRYRRSKITRDTSWTGRYRTGNDGHGHCSDLTVSGGYLWLQDNADTEEIRALLKTNPVGSVGPDAAYHQSFHTPLRLQRFSTASVSDHVAIEPFLFPGWPGAGPTYVAERGVVLTFDSLNGSLAAHHVTDDGSMQELWQFPIRTRWQPLVYADTSEVVVNDSLLFDDDNIVVLDLLTGRQKARSRSGTPVPSTGRPTPGAERDLYYVSTPDIARVSVIAGPGWAAPAPLTAVPLAPPLPLPKL
jgi:hypothetical protein